MSDVDLHTKPLSQRIWISRRLYLYILPTILLLVTFSYWPAISALYHAFFEWDPFGKSDWVGMDNFRVLYQDLFQSLPGISPSVWQSVQWTGWLGTVLLIGFFITVEAVRDRGWKWLKFPALAMLVVAVGLTAWSLVTGLQHVGDFSKTDALLKAAQTPKLPYIGWALGDFLFGHIVLLGLAGLQLASWMRWQATGRTIWWRLLAIATVGAMFFGFGLIIHMSLGGDLRASCWNLVRVMGFGLTIGMFMPLLVAEILFQMRNDRAKYIYRVLFIVPMVVPGIVGLLMWQFIYDYNWGVLNKFIEALKSPGVQVFLLAIGYVALMYLLAMYLLLRRRRDQRAGLAGVLALVLLAAPVVLIGSYYAGMLGGRQGGLAEFLCCYTGTSAMWNWLDLQPQNWLGDGDIALYSLMLMGFPWVGTISMLIFYAGLQSIPDSVLESARLDGATGVRRFVTIDFPLILGQFKLLLILGIIGGIQGFQNVMILTYGGPGKATDMPGLMMFREAFEYGKLGYGTTIGVVMFLVILTLTYVNMKYIRPSAEEESR